MTTDLEYPSVVYPWLRKQLGVEVKYVKNVDGKVSLDDMEKAVDDKTIAVAVSHVEYSNGFRHSLRVLSELANEHGAYLVVDAIQSVGNMPIDVVRDDVDFFMASGYKWLLSPPGAAYLYVKDELIDKLEPPFVGWASVDQGVFETADFYDIWNLKLSKTLDWVRGRRWGVVGDGEGAGGVEEGGFEDFAGVHEGGAEADELDGEHVVLGAEVDAVDVFAVGVVAMRYEPRR